MGRDRGSNNYGQLGIGSTTNVGTLKNATSVAKLVTAPISLAPIFRLASGGYQCDFLNLTPPLTPLPH